jgi:hypothetical protein
MRETESNINQERKRARKSNREQNSEQERARKTSKKKQVKPERGESTYNYLSNSSTGHFKCYFRIHGKNILTISWPRKAIPKFEPGVQSWLKNEYTYRGFTHDVINKGMGWSERHEVKIQDARGIYGQINAHLHHGESLAIFREQRYNIDLERRHIDL